MCRSTVTALFCPTRRLDPKLTRMKLPDGKFRWELSLDFTHVPVGADTRMSLEGHVGRERSSVTSDEGWFEFTVPVSTGLAQIWMLMPEGRTYERFEIRGFPIGQPELAETIVPTSTVDLPIGAISTFQLINPQHHYRYECSWKWSNDS